MKNKSSKGFTLIELSVVLMIIALLVTGIVGGARLIKSAKMAKFISETSLYIKEFMTFETRYEAYPGDFAGANDMFGAADINGETIHAGDGDDLIGGSTYDDYRDTESTGFFHHLFVSGIVSEPEFTGNDVANIGNDGTTNDLIDDIDEVAIDQNYPKTPFGGKTFFYVTNSTVDGRYVRTNRIVIATKDSLNENAMTPDDAETLDIKTDDGNPFKGEVIAYNETLTNGTNEDDSGCTNIYGYNTSSKDRGCIVERSFRGKEIQFDPTFISSYPNFGNIDDEIDGGSSGQCTSAPSDPPITGFLSWDTGSLPIDSGSSITATCDVEYISTIASLCTNGSWGSVTGTCTTTACTVAPADPPITGFLSWDTGSLPIDSGSSITATCDAGYTSTVASLCTDGSWGSVTGTCTATSCVVPAIDATGYENIVSWIDTSDSSSVTSGELISEEGAIAGTCGSGYAGFPETTCTTAPTWDALTESCSAASCVSATCTANASYYCGDNWDCSGDTCCNNEITSGGTTTGDCYDNCLSATFGDDTISGITGAAYGDCQADCNTSTMGNDTISNVSTAYGDCGFRCDTVMGNDIISNAGYAYGDCYSYCIGTLGDDIISDVSDTAFGDCEKHCDGTMGDDTITNAVDAYGDCYSSCDGIMGNDTIIDASSYANGDCHQSCGVITQWSTDIFRYTGSNTSTIGDFNSGGVDDKIELPSGVTVSITGTGYSRTLSHTGGTLTLQCNNTYHSCDTGGSWAILPCQVFVGGTSLSSDPTPCGGDCTTAGFDTGTCNFN
ncbi:type II secretion system protein [Pseudomonadota bacterium]